MLKSTLKTRIGEIVVHVQHLQTEAIPIVFLHGVYFDHQLFANQISAISDRTVVSIDMPLHGESTKNFLINWSLNDCAEMLKEIIVQLGFKKIIAIGHSWGSMTIVLSASKYPDLFERIGICNMPITPPDYFEILKIKLIHNALHFRKFYMQQAAKVLFAKESREKSPQIVDYFIDSMSRMSNEDVKFIDRIVRIESSDLTEKLKNLKMPVLAVIGEKDYVGLPPVNEIRVVKGAHVSPLEQPEEVNRMIYDLIHS